MPTPVLDTRDGVFYAFWSENRRSKRKSMGTSERAVAERRFAQWLLLGGHKASANPEERGALTVAELWTVYDQQHVQKHVVSKNTAKFSWANLSIHFGDLAVSDIDQTVVDDYEEARVDGEIGKACVPSTVRRELLTLRACLNWHASPERGKHRLLDKAAVPGFRLPEESDPRDRWLTSDEIRKLFAVVAKPGPMTGLEKFLWLALETAARKQAILDLTWDRVDFESGMIHYAVPGRKQTKKRRPSVPISDRLRPVLERMHSERVGTHVVDPGTSIWGALQSAVRRAGLAPAQPRRTGESVHATGVSPHTLRHTAATHMARNGIELWAIAGILGNTLAMVERVYAKHCPQRLQAAVNAISPDREVQQ